MTDHACTEMYALMKRLSDSYQQILENHSASTQAKDEKATPLFDVRRQMRDHQATCMQCRRTVQMISMQSSGRARVA